VYKQHYGCLITFKPASRAYETNSRNRNFSGKSEFTVISFDEPFIILKHYNKTKHLIRRRIIVWQCKDDCTTAVKRNQKSMSNKYKLIICRAVVAVKLFSKVHYYQLKRNRFASFCRRPLAFSRTPSQLINI